MMASSFVPGTVCSISTEVELTISCRCLPRMDLLSKSDPMCVTLIRPFGEDRFVEYHRTEVIYNCHDPNFASKVVMEYRFEEQQLLKFQVYDIDSGSTNLSDHDFIGATTCTLGQIVSSGTVKLALKRSESMTSDTNYGYIRISAEELSSNKDEVTLAFSGHDLERKDLFGWGFSDPFLEIYKSSESGEFLLVHKTEVKRWNLDPKWKHFKLPVRILCNDDYDRTLKFVCNDWNFSGSHSLIGEFETTLNALKRGPGETNRYLCINPKKKRKGGNTYKHSGIISLDYFYHHEVFSFLDYVKGGTKLHCTIAIDFTGSNGDPTQPQSLHYISEVGLNSYEQAIMEVGGIIEDYDTDKLFPVLGFGARLPPDGKVSHEFFVNMRSDNPYCNGVKGVLEAYRNCIRQIQLFGPTHFAPVVKHVANFASAYRNRQGTDYFILLILTDGVINDMGETMKAIVEAAVLPLSIIIVGIGSADFSAMQELDGDTVRLSWNGIKAARDIVQFVPFSKFTCASAGSRLATQRLAKEVLAEIPGQLISYMQADGIKPSTTNHNISSAPVEYHHGRS